MERNDYSEAYEIGFRIDELVSIIKTKKRNEKQYDYWQYEV
jgi:hypothetical protein